MELAVRYVPASAHAEIGGDFYEAIQTPEGHVPPLLLADGTARLVSEHGRLLGLWPTSPCSPPTSFPKSSDSDIP